MEQHQNSQNQQQQINIHPQILLLQQEIIDVRRQIHENPETAYEEFQTAQLIVDHLKPYEKQIKIIQNVGKTGVVAILEGKKEGPCIMLRADMDALNLTENSGVQFQSKNIGKHHACGHDGHVSMLLAAIKVLCKQQDQIKGIIKFCFQPAEEGQAGARAMVNDKVYPVLENPKVDQAYGMHLYNTQYYPKITSKGGAISANSDRVYFNIQGVGSSAYLPQYSVDAVYISSQLINALYSITSRNTDPMSPSTISIGKIYGGSAPNIIASECKLEGSVRSLSNQDRDFLENRIKEVAHGIEITFKCKIDVNYVRNYNSVNNNEILVQKVLNSCKKVSPQSVSEGNFGLAGEDFCFFSDLVPSAFFMVGSAPENSLKGEDQSIVTIPHHSPLFTIDERSLLLGASIWVQLVEDLLIKNENN